MTQGKVSVGAWIAVTLLTLVAFGLLYAPWVFMAWSIRKGSMLHIVISVVVVTFSVVVGAFGFMTADTFNSRIRDWLLMLLFLAPGPAATLFMLHAVWEEPEPPPANIVCVPSAQGDVCVTIPAQGSSNSP